MGIGAGEEITTATPEEVGDEAGWADAEDFKPLASLDFLGQVAQGSPCALQGLPEVQHPSLTTPGPSLGPQTLSLACLSPTLTREERELRQGRSTDLGSGAQC